MSVHWNWIVRCWSYHHGSYSKPFVSPLEETKHALYPVSCLFQWLESDTSRINDRIDVWDVLEALISDFLFLYLGDS